MSKILIITDYYPPYGGPRMAYFSDFLLRRGWYPYIVRIENMPCGEYIFRVSAKIPIISIPYDNIIPTNPKLSLIKRIVNFIFNPEVTNEGHLAKAIVNIVNKELKDIKFDLILTSTSFMLSFFTAAKKLSYMMKTPWVADIRDIHEQNLFVKPTFRRKLRIKRNSIRRSFLLRTASLVTTISDWHTDTLALKRLPTVVTIFNGYDPELFFPAAIKKTKKFIITYTGSMVDGTDMTILLDAILKLTQENKILLQDIMIQTYGRDPERLGEYDYHPCRRIIKANYIIPQNELMEVFASSSILLSLIAESKGMMTTKAYEYIASLRPILSIPVADGSLMKVINETKSGLCSNDINEVADFVLEKYAEWQKYGYVLNNELSPEVLCYSRERQSEIHEDLLKKIIRIKNDNKGVISR